VTDPSQPEEPQPGDALPQRGGELPRRKPGGGSLPRRGGSLFERPESLSSPAPQPSPPNGLPKRPSTWGPQSSDGDGRQRDTGGLPQRDTGGLPQRDTGGLPQRDTGGLPQRDTGGLPQRDTGGLPQRAPAGNSAGALPRRTRSRPVGRHRSPHRLSVASDAPALVIAVPGAAKADSDEIGFRVAATAELSCPGVDIRVGYLEGDEQQLSDCLLPEGPQADDHDQFPTVVVPLLLSPNVNVDTRLRELIARPPVPTVLAAHLGPHPLVAEALHARLADAGLARQARSTGLSISAESRGVVVLADVGDQAANAAGVAAVLLASRLSVPVVPASLGDPASIVDAVNRLSESGAARPALAPCLIGPETNIGVLEDLSGALGAPCAPTLGAHQAIGQLVAIRYGAALASLSLTG
jgi:sirohydrochlorin ferrochelatase